MSEIEIDVSDVTRVEVTDESGRVMVRYGVRVEVHLQDDGRTLKVFVEAREAGFCCRCLDVRPLTRRKVDDRAVCGACGSPYVVEPGE